MISLVALSPAWPLFEFSEFAFLCLFLIPVFVAQHNFFGRANKARVSFRSPTNAHILLFSHREIFVRFLFYCNLKANNSQISKTFSKEHILYNSYREKKKINATISKIHYLRAEDKMAKLKATFLCVLAN